MNKNRQIIGELQELFANNDASKAAACALPMSAFREKDDGGLLRILRRHSLRPNLCIATCLFHPVSQRLQAATSRCADAPGRAMQLPRVRAVSENPKLRYTNSSAC